MIAVSPAIVNVLRSRLRAGGLEVTGASNWIEGERRALADDVTLVVLDQIVPGRDALDVIMVVRHRKPALPIIVLSDHAEVADRIAAFDAGASDFLAKPFSPGELVARVRAQLRRAAWK
ncbi:MAG: response regulator transcription factor [Solirubrobacteraceae bacterium]